MDLVIVFLHCGAVHACFPRDIAFIAHAGVLAQVLRQLLFLGTDAVRIRGMVTRGRRCVPVRTGRRRRWTSLAERAASPMNLTRSAFYAWSEEARKKKEDCDNSAITPEEFSCWLKES